ncbi:hypothetical protein BJ875DRAFT_467290 [Amylocarpus encephaloides]|uniref:FAD dependent oxidoreductase domain-containing protein n=1 Tax=Amylocarpus encephaloides TaxID=45428 RepID=A0A9P7YEI1_9HELO|nr:hypothetical protein BJ875DRAFT_467290 [Amylocarpus encephaloides]
MMENNIVVIGAGVSGLTTALLLAKDPWNKVTVVAKHMPGDYDIEYTSPWAGADYHPFAKAGTPEATYEHETWQHLANLAENVPEAGIHFQKSHTYIRNKDLEIESSKKFGDSASSSPWWKDTVPDFRILSPDELPKGIDGGTEFTSVCINTTLYLPYLVGQCRKHGVVVKRQIISHVREASGHHHTFNKADVVINCTGLMASKLGGVNDQSVIPARGQIVVVRNDPNMQAACSGTDNGNDELCYYMCRASGGGTVIGGSYQLGNWESQPDPNLALRIMKRAVELNPALVDGKGVEGLSIIRHAVGLRPYRAQGVRLEKEKIKGVGWVVHNYGHAGYGYQASYGCSQAVVKLVDGIIESKARL